MSRAVGFFLIFGIFAVSALRKHADSAKVAARISSNEDHVATLEAQIATLESENQQHAALGEYDVSDKSIPLNNEIDKPSPWSEVQIWGWLIDTEGPHKGRLWGLTDLSGYLPEKLQAEHPRLKVEANGFETFKEFEAWLKENHQSFGGYGPFDVYDPFVVIDGKYVGGYKGLAKAIAEKYPESAEAQWGPIG